MLRGREITRAALILALALWASPALAQVDGEHYAPGAACPPGSTPGHAVIADWDTFFECNGSSQMQRGPYFFGASSDTCDSTHEGLTRYDSTAHALYACNGTSWIPIDGGVHFISTQTASNSASLQWTGLGSYNTYFLSCNGIVPATNSAVFGIQVGEGATPTWETGASYIGDLALVFSAGNTANNLSETGTQLNLTTALSDQSGGFTGYDASIKLWIGGLASSNVKQMTFLTIFDAVSPGGAYGGSGGGAYYGDMNPITALRVLMSSGNISVGTCSLYGMN